jgi:hypothetical protein
LLAPAVALALPGLVDGIVAGTRARL